MIDENLEHIQGLTNLAGLNLSCTQVRDAGLVHLKGLTTLTFLNLYGYYSPAIGMDWIW